MRTPKINVILFGLYAILSIVTFIASLISPPLRQYSYAPLRELIFPKPDPIKIDLLYSTEKEQWLSEVIDDFSATNPTVDGRPIEINLTQMGSREMILSVMDSEQTPTIISPASSLQTSIFENLSASKFGRPLIVANDTNSCQSVVTTPLVLVAWKERANVLWGLNPPNDAWQKLHDAVINPNGWQAFGKPEWGYVKFGHTNPLKSNSGFMTLVLMTYDYFDISSNLTSNDILSDREYQEWLVEIESTISNFGDSTGTYMKDIIVYGPSVYDIVAVYESTAIEQADNALGKYGELQIYYPPQTILSDHPFCVLDADWVTDSQQKAAKVFINYLLSTHAQELAMMKYGFRPVDPSIALDQPGSPFSIYKTNGLQTDLPAFIELPEGDVLNTLLEFWSRNIQNYTFHGEIPCWPKNKFTNFLPF